MKIACPSQSQRLRRHTFFANIFAKTKNFAKLFKRPLVTISVLITLRNVVFYTPEMTFCLLPGILLFYKSLQKSQQYFLHLGKPINSNHRAQCHEKSMAFYHMRCCFIAEHALLILTLFPLHKPDFFLFAGLVRRESVKFITLTTSGCKERKILDVCQRI